MLGMDSVLETTMSIMTVHAKAVSRASRRALVVVDMPFMSYEPGPTQALASAATLLKAGADAVRIEGGEEIVDQVKKIVRAGIPVMGRIGVSHRRLVRLGGYRVAGKKEAKQEQLLRDALALQEAGVFAVTLEHVDPSITKMITDRLEVPTICMDSGPHCDGQVLSLYEMLGLSRVDKPFVKKYADLKETVLNALKHFVEDVKKDRSHKSS